jgi:5,10-methylenetetrahydromethanopterin reductase
MVQFSFGISGSKPINDYIELARLAEEYGFHTLSIFDDLMFKPAWPILFTIAQHTGRIRLGPSVSNPYLIHPAILAEQAALLDELSGGRAYFGIGRGAFLDLVQVTPEKPIAGVREAIEIARQLWRGDRRVYPGKVFQLTEAAHLHWQPARSDIPVMVGTWGPRMCRMAGAVAQEVKAGSMWSAQYGQYMWEQIAAGARQAGRDPAEVGLVFGPLTSIAQDRDQAKAFARRTLAFYLPYLSPMPEYLGIEPAVVSRVQAATARGDLAAAEAEISQSALDHFALYGTPHDVIAGIERMVAETRVTRIEFGMPHSPNGSHEAIHLLGREVLPHFARG